MLNRNAIPKFQRFYCMGLVYYKLGLAGRNQRYNPNTPQYMFNQFVIFI